MFGSEKGAGLFASVSIRNLTFGLVAFTLLFGATLFVLTWRTFDLSRVSDDLWSEYYSTSNQEVRSVSGVVSALGYGGMIHNFQDFLLRKDQRRSTETQRRIGALTETLDQLALIDVSAEERQAIGLLRDTVATYGDRLRSARILVAENKSAAQIDAQVRYDDGPAIDAINLLVERVQSDAAAVSSDLYPPVQLLTLQHTLGYGGVIHQFKNHVLRRDDQTQNNFWDAVARAQDEITKYRSLKITGEERRALDVIETMVSAYSRRMEQVAEMNASDMTAEQTDDVVAYNDGPVLAAISVLERALNSRSAQVAQALSKQLAATERLSL
jgi:hypothetical protein